MKNIVFIVVDAFRPKNSNLFEYTEKTDSYLKEISKDCILFKKHFSVSNCTLPSFTSLFSGLYPNHAAVHFQTTCFEKGEAGRVEDIKFWFPSYLQSKGYNTIGIDWLGLWLKNGFDYYEEAGESKIREIFRKPVLRDIKPIIKKTMEFFSNIKDKIKKGEDSELFPSGKKIINLAISKVKETQEQDKDSRKPFFLFMHFWDTHFPFPTIKYSGSGDDETQEILESIKDEEYKKYFKKRIESVNLKSMKDINEKYDLALSNVDKQIKKFCKFLKSEGLWDDLILIVLGDHGWNLNEHEIYFNSCGVYDESVHVPLMMKLPGIEGKEINELVQNIDVVPTIMDYIGKENQEGEIDGVSLLSLIQKGEKVRDKVFLFDGFARDLVGIRTKNKKLIVSKNEDNNCLICKTKHHKGKEEYDLEKDPEEKEDISNNL